MIVNRIPSQELRVRTGGAQLLTFVAERTNRMNPNEAMGRACPLKRSVSLTRRQMLSGAAALGAASFLPGCGSSASSNVPPPSGAGTGSTLSPQPTPTGTLVSSSLTVTGTVAGSIGPRFAGLSWGKTAISENPRLFDASNTDLLGLFQLLGPSLLRVGGSDVDTSQWNPNGAGQTKGEIAPSDVDALAAFVKATGWQILYAVNLGGAGPHPATSGGIVCTTTPQLAANEVAYAAQAFGPSLYGIEIGNEPDAYGSTYFSGTTWNLSTFESLWEEFRAAILAQTPGVVITGPADAGSESSWTVPFGEAVGSSNISLLTQHYYRGDATLPSSTVENLITYDSGLVDDLNALKTAARKIGVPFRMAECNSYYTQSQSTACDSYASALWVIDFLFNCAQAGAIGANLNNIDVSLNSPYGYAPIATSGGAVWQVRPEYYGMLLFTLAGQGSLYTTALSVPGNLNVTAYAVNTIATGISIVVNNKDSSNNLSLSIQLPQTASRARLLEMTQLSAGASAPSLSANTGITIQGAPINLEGSFTPGTPYNLTINGTQLNCYVPALSAVLIQIS